MCVKLGPDKILGVSARTVEQAISYRSVVADYLGGGVQYLQPVRKQMRQNFPMYETLEAILVKRYLSLWWQSGDRSRKIYLS